ncbi:MAG: flagellar brake protein [Acidobacteriota bacterium]
MSISLLKENLLIEIEIDSHTSHAVFPSRIEGVGQQTLLIGAPIHLGALIPLHRGDTVKINFIHKDQAFSFYTRVIRRVDHPLALVEIEKPTEMDKLQRREYVRLRVSMPICFRIVPPGQENVAVTPSDEFYDANTIDISGGGVLFITKNVVKREDLLDIRMNLPKRENLLFRAKVVRSTPSEINGEKKYTVATVFDRPREVHRDAIVGFIFDKQREFLKKGLL